MTRSRGKRYQRRGPPKPTPAERRRAREAGREAKLAPPPATPRGGGAGSLLYSVLRIPFRLAGRALRSVAQVIFSIVFLILHPQFKWLLRLVLRSRLVRDHIRPALQGIVDRLYRPYFAFLRGLPPFLATVSIAIPLAVLEPAKLYATILIVEHPKTGLTLWLFLQALSFVLIDTTWTAVRPQSRRIWLVSRLHALIWLAVSYGKNWVIRSAAYRAMKQLLSEARRALRVFLVRLRMPRQAKTISRSGLD
jgi:hypothetical protein